MIYLDANIFIFAAIHTDRKGARAREVLRSVSNGSESAITSCLTFDEVAWGVIKRTQDRKLAIDICNLIMRIPHLKIRDVREQDIQRSFRLMEKYHHLKPRDAIHAAVTLGHGIQTVVSDDSDFDGIEEIEWQPLVKDQSKSNNN